MGERPGTIQTSSKDERACVTSGWHDPSHARRWIVLVGGGGAQTTLTATASARADRRETAQVRRGLSCVGTTIETKPIPRPAARPAPWSWTLLVLRIGPARGVHRGRRYGPKVAGVATPTRWGKRKESSKCQCIHYPGGQAAKPPATRSVDHGSKINFLARQAYPQIGTEMVILKL